MPKMPMSPLNIANMLAAVAHNKARRGTVNNYPEDMQNGDADHKEDAYPSPEAVANNRKSPTQVAAMKEKEAGKDNPGKPPHNPPVNPSAKASGFKSGTKYGKQGKSPGKPARGNNSGY